ncbi:MAG: type II toxin-antitoxin system HicA family toxin [Nitrospirae bacterium]|nr:type II toxin-antitoxin system HicA family toxin [Nitrospirota bacterium]MBF0533595.1 type II toxin-antitoxin system HicA family toxin [Nitrospirota bacterium]MBF0617988.1 type II toxin-antitoxin system HicA family toxin [Nitrospirota bacterium]
MPRIVPVSYEKLGNVFEKAGFKLARVEGDHFIYTKTGVVRPVVIPNRKDVPVFIIKNNLRTAGISRDEYFRLLTELNG